MTPEAQLLLHAPLASDVEATLAFGDTAAAIDPKGTPPTFLDDGIRAGARFGHDTCVRYAVEDNFRREEGTVMLWFKPDWAAQEAFPDGLGRILWDLRIEHGSVVGNDPSQRCVAHAPRALRDLSGLPRCGRRRRPRDQWQGAGDHLASAWSRGPA